jgi:hypothetical protein
MILESQSLRNITTLRMDMSECTLPMRMFSSGAFDRFLTGNQQQLKNLYLGCVTIDNDACDVFVRNTYCLDKLEMYRCTIDVQQFVRALGENVYGPRAVELIGCATPNTEGQARPEIYFESIIFPLLKNQRTKSLRLSFTTTLSGSDYRLITAAFKFCQGLENFMLKGRLTYYPATHADACRFFKALAEAPKLRTHQAETR